MELIPFATRCRDCHCPMTIQVEPYGTLLRVVLCEACLLKRVAEVKAQRGHETICRQRRNYERKPGVFTRVFR